MENAALKRLAGTFRGWEKKSRETSKGERGKKEE